MRNTKNSSPPAKKRRKTNTKNSSPSPPLPLLSIPSFSLLPDEITVTCLARISRSYYTKLSIVSKSFSSLLSSTELYAERSQRGITEHCLYFCLRDPDQQFPQWFTLWINPNRTLHDDSSVTNKKKKKKIKKKTGQLLVPIPSSKFPSASKSVVVVGSEVYVIGGPVNDKPSSTVQILDCRTHTWRDAPSMNVARENAASCFYDGKIYVLGGCKELEDGAPWAEVFDKKTQTWEHLSDQGTEIRKHHHFRIAEINGKIYVGPVGNMYAYDTKQGKWEFCENKMENVLYFCYRNNIWCFNIKDGRSKKVKGLDSLVEKHSGGVSTSKLVSFGGKLILTWEESMMRGKKIWCAEIMLEKREGGEVWGNVEWADVVHRGPRSWGLLHCLAVSV